MTPFRNEKNSNWEGAFRVPMVVRWPGKIKPGQISTRSSAPTSTHFLAMAGEPDIAEKLKAGYQAIRHAYNHLDAYNLVPYHGQEKEPAQFLHVSER